MTKKTDHHGRRADRAVRSISAIGTKRHGNKNDGKIKSINTQMQYRQTLKMASRYLQTIKGHLSKLTPDQAIQYLKHRSGEIQQKQLANERQTLRLYLRQLHRDPKLDLPKFKSTRESPDNASRYYSRDQVKHIIKHSSDRLKLSTAIAYQAGLRVHELLTIARADERPVEHRKEDWHPDRFAGRKHWISYTVIGKGNLPREIKLSPELSQKLEQNRTVPTIKRDRTIAYETQYNLLAGKALTDAFSEVSNTTLGYSSGPHGLRHSYAQDRIVELMCSGKSEEESKAIVVQELGHFSTSNLSYYLR